MHPGRTSPSATLTTRFRARRGRAAAGVIFQRAWPRRARRIGAKPDTGQHPNKSRLRFHAKSCQCDREKATHPVGASPTLELEPEVVLPLVQVQVPPVDL